MKLARFAALVLVSSFAFACKGNELVKAQEEFADKTCACKDVACLKKVPDEQIAWVTAHGQASGGSEADGEKLAASTQRMSDCATKIAMAGH